MADIVYRANLKAASFPFLSEFSGRSIIVRQQDQNYIPGLAAKDAIDSVSGIPQIYYAHNVIPTDSGYRSVGYTTFAASPGSYTFSDVYTIRDGSGNSAQLCLDAAGNLHVMEAGATNWSIPAGAPAAADVIGCELTVAFVSGTTYIYLSLYGCYKYDFTLHEFVAVTLTGVTAGDILGIVGAYGYLLVYSSDTSVAWSSTIDATDFTPDLATGAGGGNLEGALGQLVSAKTVNGGMVFFCEDNAVGAVWNNNVRYPFTFNPIAGSGGITDRNHVSADDGSGGIIAYTKSGLQTLYLSKASVITAPEVTDFISGSRFETFDESTLEMTVVEQGGATLTKRLALVADRYLILSYGFSGYMQHALYYDLAYKQWGRLKIDHVDCFEFVAYSAGVEVPKRSIAFVAQDGTVKILNSDVNTTTDEGVLILGKYQYVRSRMMTLQHAEFENVEDGASFALHDLVSIDGKNIEYKVAGYLMPDSVGKNRHYGFLKTGMNHSLVCIGAFNAVSLVLTFTVHGAR